jgi:hypothetical protein
MKDATARLGNLQGWADFLCEELHAPLGLEKGELREIRELSWSLRDKLQALRTQLEFRSTPRSPLLKS